MICKKDKVVHAGTVAGKTKAKGTLKVDIIAGLIRVIWEA